MKIKTCRAPGSVETADFNHDHIPDLAVTSETDSAVTILLGIGKGSFSEAAGSPFFAGHAPNDIAIADLNKDGNPDLAVANHERNYITVLLGNGKGTFSQAANSPFAATVMPHTHGIAIGNFNGDQYLDLVTDSWGNNQVEILYGDSTRLFKTQGTFLDVGKHPYQRLRTADVNRDGLSDIITTNLDGNNTTVLLCDGRGNFKNAEGSPFPCGDAPFGVSINDLNADGDPDLAIINSPASTGGQSAGINGLTILFGDGTGKFATVKGSPFKAGNIPNRVMTGDVNGDGINDIIVSDNNGNRVYLYLMGKNGVISQASIIVGNQPKGIAIADINNDGKNDIIVCNNGDDDLSIISYK